MLKKNVNLRSRKWAPFTVLDFSQIYQNIFPYLYTRKKKLNNRFYKKKLYWIQNRAPSLRYPVFRLVLLAIL